MTKIADPEGFQKDQKPIKVRSSSIKHTPTSNVFNSLLDLAADDSDIANAFSVINGVNMEEGRGSSPKGNG